MDHGPAEIEAKAVFLKQMNSRIQIQRIPETGLVWNETFGERRETFLVFKIGERGVSSPPTV